MKDFIGAITLLSGIRIPDSVPSIQTTGTFTTVGRGGNFLLISQISGSGTNGISYQIANPFDSTSFVPLVNRTIVGLSAGANIGTFVTDIFPIAHPLTDIRAITSGSGIFYSAIIVKG